jgi:hypothetical protein
VCADPTAKGKVPMRLALPEELLLELLLRGALEVTDRGLLVVAGRPTGDELLDEVLKRIRSSRRRRSLKGWVGVLAGQRWPPA